MKLGFDGGIKLEFHGSKVSSDCGLLAHRDLDDAPGLFGIISLMILYEEYRSKMFISNRCADF